jgi:hypothetical protein
MRLSLPIFVVMVMPVIAANSPSWIFYGGRSRLVWAALSGAGLLAFGLVMGLIPGNPGAAALAATPLLQAVVFVIFDRLFFYVTGRVPVSYGRNRRLDGRRWWPDKLFWMLIFFGLIGLGVFVCVHFGVSFSTRR